MRPGRWSRGPAAPAQGFALPVALIAIMLIGALVTGGFYASSRDNRDERSEVLNEQASYVAEVGLEEALAAWRNGSLARVDSVFVQPAEEVVQGEEPIGSYEIDIRRLGPALYLLSSTGRVRSLGRTVVRRAASVLRVVEPGLPAPAALAVFGGVSVGEDARIDGTRADGEDCGGGKDVAGVATHDASLVHPEAAARITGTPPVESDPEMDIEALSRFGDVPLELLIAEATRVYEDGESESRMGPASSVDSTGAEVCDASIRGNWGDPSGTGPCSDVFPVILGVGDLHVATGSGQGILVVEGDLTMGGDFVFHGVVIVKGRLHSTGTGNRVEGGVVVHGDGQPRSESATLEGSAIRYSPCRVERAFDAVLHPQSIASGSRAGRSPVGRGVAAGIREADMRTFGTLLIVLTRHRGGTSLKRSATTAFPGTTGS